jgi:hypothetical protein|tara:strand:+ start:6138 stop:6923 length:786 start_codon:yes stop_codon:yes gene_type:complete
MNEDLILLKSSPYPIKVPSLPDRKFLTDEETEFAVNDIDNFRVELNPIQYNAVHFKGYPKVIIVGSQRSGTTFVSNALSKTLGFHHWDETDFNVKNVVQFQELLNRNYPQGGVVMQAPGLTHIIHALVDEDCLVVFMDRKWSDILKSVIRKNGKVSSWIKMNVLYESNKFHYTHGYSKLENWSYNDVDLDAEKVYEEKVDKNSYYLDVTYKMWKYYQRDRIQNYVELDYESMSNHGLWIPKKNRKDFNPKQFELQGKNKNK